MAILKGAKAAGIGAISPAPHASHASGQLELAIFEESGENATPTLSTAAGFALTSDGTTSARVTVNGPGPGANVASGVVFHRVWNGSDGTPTLADQGNHQQGYLVSIPVADFDFDAADPIHSVWLETGQGGSNGTARSAPGGTSIPAGALVIAIVVGAIPDADAESGEFASWANADLASVTELIDSTTAFGNGGSLGVAYGVFTAGGTLDPTTVTTTTSTRHAGITIVINPNPGAGGEEHSGSFSATGGGTAVFTAAKTGNGTFVGTGGGIFTHTATKEVSAPFTGSGGGIAVFTASTERSGSFQGTGAGLASFEVATSREGSFTGTGGGIATFEGAATEAHEGSFSATGGGVAAFVAEKGAAFAFTGTGGGIAVFSGEKTALGLFAATGGGIAVFDWSPTKQSSFTGTGGGIATFEGVGFEEADELEVQSTLDFGRPVTYRSLQLNDAARSAPGMPVAGIRLVEVNFSAVPGVGYTEKRSQADGRDASDVYLDSRRIYLRGVVYGNNKGNLHDRLQLLRSTLTPTGSYGDDPSAQGYVPLDFEEPTEDIGNWPTGMRTLFIRARPLATPSFTLNRDRMGGENEKGGGVPWEAVLEAKDPRVYVRPSVLIDFDDNDTSDAGHLINRGDYPAPMNAMLVVEPQAKPGFWVFTGAGVVMKIAIPQSAQTQTIRYDGYLKTLTVEEGALEEITRMDLLTDEDGEPLQDHPLISPGVGTTNPYGWTSVWSGGGTTYQTIPLAAGSRIFYNEAYA